MRSPLACWLVLLLLTPRVCFCRELNERQIPAVVFNSRLLSRHECHRFPPPPSTRSCCPVPALLGLERRQEAQVMGWGLWARLQVRGYLLSAFGTPGWKNCSSGVMLMLMVPTWPCPLLWVPSE